MLRLNKSGWHVLVSINSHCIKNTKDKFMAIRRVVFSEFMCWISKIQFTFVGLHARNQNWLIRFWFG